MLKVYYNNNCSICRIEINHYIRMNTQKIKWIDISNNREAEKELDKNASQLLRRLHVKYDGEVFEGAKAFIILWDMLPGYRWLSKLVSFPIIYQLFYITYEIVAILLYLKNRGQLNGS